MSSRAANPHYDPAKPHHRPEGFQNRYTAFAPKGLVEVLKWRWQASRMGVPQPPRTPTPQVPADVAALTANAAVPAAMRPSATWLGHATVLAQFGGRTWITDPVFSGRASPFATVGPRRAQPPGIALHALPHVDVALISHNHYDHLDDASVRALNGQRGGPPLFVVPLGLGAWLARRGVQRVVELDWWSVHSVDGVDVMLTPAQHWSGRGVADRMATLWGGFAVFAPDFHFFYAGDTGYSRDFADIAAHCAPRQRAGGFDLALLPIGAYAPRWFMQVQHINPAEALQIHRDLGAKRSLGVHWGTFQLTDEPLDEPPLELARQRALHGVADDAFVVTAIGHTLWLPRREAT
ncbi:MAG: MBL fold metallo-hydrolase [Betaproteobacteria bacterium]|nr:MBL fold metallo-hydrolase [Betaproteobacteria bacterium]